MLIIPSLELENGICTQCIAGEPGTERLYTGLQIKPDELIKLFRKENFKAVHLIDKDSLLKGKSINFGIIQHITEAVDIPVELHAGFQTVEDCRKGFEAGLYRLILSSGKLLTNLNLCKKIIKEFSASRVCFAMILKDGNFYDENMSSAVEPENFLDGIVSIGAKRVLLGSYESVFQNGDFKIHDYAKILEYKHIKFTMYGGINTPQKLWDISRNKSLNIDSAIIGKAIFNNSFPCQKIWRIAESELENVKKT